MRSSRRIFAGALVLGFVNLNAGFAGAVTGFNPHCASVPRINWLSAEEVGDRLRAAGFEIVRVRLADDRCYAVEARDEVGRLRKFLVHPVSADIITHRN
jgi:hypothetical protein